MRVRGLSAWVALTTVLGIALTGAAAGPRVYREPGLITAPGYRHVADLSALTAEDRAWLAEGRIPGVGTPWSDMATWALLDLRAFVHPNGAVAAGPGQAWTYTWPRDAAFVAVALSRTGHRSDAVGVLDFLSTLPFDSATGFDARYTLAGHRVRGPAQREAQSDGCGWVLWAVSTVRAHPPPAGPMPVDARVDDLVSRCTATLIALTGGGRRLPPATPDYVELPVSGTTLATVAPMLTGLRAAVGDYLRRGERAAALVAAVAADQLDTTLAARLGPRYERYGGHGGADAGSAMLMPPLGDGGAAETAAWLRYQAEARRPAGGLAPAVDWRADGTSWTPETALVAYVAAGSGRPDLARGWLTWLDAHRTAYGSLPEKVTRSGLPAGPAPLLWTSALVLLTLTELDER
jgi:hypothetical protein